MTGEGSENGEEEGRPRKGTTRGGVFREKRLAEGETPAQGTAKAKPRQQGKNGGGQGKSGPPKAACPQTEARPGLGFFPPEGAGVRGTRARGRGGGNAGRGKEGARGKGGEGLRGWKKKGGGRGGPGQRGEGGGKTKGSTIHGGNKIFN